MTNVTELDNDGHLFEAKFGSSGGTGGSQAPGVGDERATRPRPAWNRVGRELGYLIPNLPITIAEFVVAVTGFSLGVGLLPLFAVGLAILVGTLVAARGMATFERARLAILEGQPVGPVSYRPSIGSGLARLWSYPRDRQLWRDWGFLLISFPVRIATWSIAVSWVAAAIGGLTYPLWQWSLPDDHVNGSLSHLLGFAGQTPDVVLNMGIGLVAALTLPRALRALTSAESALVRGMLTNKDAASSGQPHSLCRRPAPGGAAGRESARDGDRGHPGNLEPAGRRNG